MNLDKHAANLIEPPGEHHLFKPHHFLTRFKQFIGSNNKERDFAWPQHGN